MRTALRVPPFLVVLIAIALPPDGVAGATQDPAAAFVESLGNETLAVLSDPAATPAERMASYRALLERGFDIDVIARFVVGRYWRMATPEQRNEYLVLFREFVLGTYAERLDSYSGERFSVIKAEPLDAKDTLVMTEIVGQSGPPIRVDYRVRGKGGDHRIVDVLVEGVSLVVTQRSEFASVITRDGFDGLLAKLREQAAGESTATN